MNTVSPPDAEAVLQEHRRFFATGATLPIAYRIGQLNRLGDAIRRYEQRLSEALYQDLHKSETEAYMSEIGYTLSSLRLMTRKLKRWAKPERTGTPIFQMPASSRILREPYGTVLIIGPFNYPFQLLIEPLLGAIAAGNCAVLKPSENTPHVSAVIAELIRDTFDPSYIRLIEGEKETTAALTAAPFDYIFFTGSVPVGRIVMEAAAKNLVPVTLELGGKSPVIVERTADLKTAAQRIAWGKLMNAGQTCIAPDYLLVDKSVKQELVARLKEAFTRFYGEDASASPDFGRIVNVRQFDRLAGVLEKDKEGILHGGKMDRDRLYIEPTLLEADFHRSASMQEELFGPLLPILEYDSLDEAIRLINSRPKPLALYLFTSSKEVEEEVLARVPFGGGSVNDTISHIVNPELPFGGVGSSGIGAYHGRHSYELFSHKKSVMKRSTKFNSSFLYPPYGDKLKWIRKILK